MIPQDPSDISRLRISDADRDRAASVLSDALAEGRLTPDEHSERLDAVYAAKTAADLVPIVGDLPGAAAALAVSRASLASQYPGGQPAVAGSSAHLVAVFGGVSRKGVWQVPAEIDAVNVFGGTELDLREAVLTSRETRIRAVCILGGMEIVVPPEMHVVDSGIAVMGGREIPPDTEESAGPDAPVLRLSGISLLGGVSVKRKRRKGDKAAKNVRPWEH